MAKVLTKSQIIQAIADAHKEKLARKDVAGVLAVAGHGRLQGAQEERPLRAPGFAKFVVVKKPATKERKGINPFTKEPIDLQGEAGPQGAEGAPGEGRQGRSVRTLSYLSPLGRGEGPGGAR